MDVMQDEMYPAKTEWMSFLATDTAGSSHIAQPQVLEEGCC